MGLARQSTRIELRAGTTVALQLQGLAYPLSYTLIVPAGGTVTRRGSCAARPGGQYVAPKTDSNLQPGGHAIGETTPFAWIELAATVNDTAVHIVSADVSHMAVHYSDTDAMPANSADNLELKAGESKDYTVHDLIGDGYPKGSVNFEVESADDTKVTASFDHVTGITTVNGLAATADTDVTVTMTSPTGNTSTRTISVEVT